MHNRMHASASQTSFRVTVECSGSSKNATGRDTERVSSRSTPLWVPLLAALCRCYQKNLCSRFLLKHMSAVWAASVLLLLAALAGPVNR